MIVRGDARVEPSGRELGGGGQREEDGVAEHGDGLVRSYNCLACLAQSGLAMRYDRSYGGGCVWGGFVLEAEAGNREQSSIIYTALPPWRREP